MGKYLELKNILKDKDFKVISLLNFKQKYLS